LALGPSAYGITTRRVFGSDSDGPQPHAILVEFPRKVTIEKISICLNISLDESYTPSLLQIKAGTSISDLQEVRQVTLDKPDGWVDINLYEPGQDEEAPVPLFAYVLQVVIIANHMAGKDTHVRGMRILGPQPIPVYADEHSPFPFVDNRFRLYQRIR